MNQQPARDYLKALHSPPRPRRSNFHAPPTWARPHTTAPPTIRQCTWKGECQYYSLSSSPSSSPPIAGLPDAMWSYETGGAGKCAGDPGCPSAVTCAEIENSASFDPAVTVTVAA